MCTRNGFAKVLRGLSSTTVARTFEFELSLQCTVTPGGEEMYVLSEIETCRRNPSHEHRLLRRTGVTSDLWLVFSGRNYYYTAAAFKIKNSINPIVSSACVSTLDYITLYMYARMWSVEINKIRWEFLPKSNICAAQNPGMKRCIYRSGMQRCNLIGVYFIWSFRFPILTGAPRGNVFDLYGLWPLFYFYFFPIRGIRNAPVEFTWRSVIRIFENHI
jgi:hypothetical protein